MPVYTPSLLSMIELGIAPYALRGISQTLEPIDAAGDFRRTASGTLIHISAPQFQKYRTTIRCSDLSSPGLDNVWQGMRVTMHCAAELGYEGSTDTSGRGRPAVPNSIRDEEGWTFYRPIIVFLITGYSIDFAEWDAEYAWELTAEEE